MDLVFAYLDPGSASIVFQAVIAGIIAIPVLFRSPISAAIRAVRGGQANQAKESAPEPSTNDATGH